MVLDMASRRNVKMHSDDRTLVLQQLPGERTLNSQGLVDTRLFKGGNAIHATRVPQSSLWQLKYETGGLPPALKQRFTSFETLLKYTKEYFEKRGLSITEVVDNHA